MRYFGNSDLKLRYCGILKTCGIRFLAFWSVLKIILPLFSTLFDLFQVSFVSETAADTLRNSSIKVL